MIQANILSIKEHIASICQRLGRDAEDIVFVGVTKYADAAKLQEVVASGVTDIGENRVQEAKVKFEALKDLKGIRKHLIGHLQTNKVKEAVQLFDLIQSADSLKVIKEIDKQSAKLNKITDILMEVNISGEKQKYGFSSEDVIPLIKEVSHYKYIRVLGLMTMAPFVEDKNIIRACFCGLKNLFEEVKQECGNMANVEMKYLSMGMTADYEIALEEGSNMIRIGRAMYK